MDPGGILLWERFFFDVITQLTTCDDARQRSHSRFHHSRLWELLLLLLLRMHEILPMFIGMAMIPTNAAKSFADDAARDLVPRKRGWSTLVLVLVSLTTGLTGRHSQQPSLVFNLADHPE